MQFMAKKIEKTDNYTLNGISLEVLYLIHKKKSVEEIKEITSLQNEEITIALKELIENDLIIQASKNGNFLGNEFINALQRNLAKALGPLAGFLVEDAFSEFDINPEKIPKNQAASIIRFLSEEIKDSSLKINFIKTMNEFLK
ncbi:MAG: hypothetical protein RBR08_09015 [Desulforegulaceae bacterium]|jgi:hypothetical protein|nr:hypothetical protein [Desulforegulaceae bacterium]